MDGQQPPAETIDIIDTEVPDLPSSVDEIFENDEKRRCAHTGCKRIIRLFGEKYCYEHTRKWNSAISKMSKAIERREANVRTRWTNAKLQIEAHEVKAKLLPGNLLMQGQIEGKMSKFNMNFITAKKTAEAPIAPAPIAAPIRPYNPSHYFQNAPMMNIG